MAGQLRGLPAAATRADSVNLDNLFDFLADVPTQRGAPDGQPDAHQPTIAEIGDSMERLVDDLDHEVGESLVNIFVSYSTLTLCVVLGLLSNMMPIRA